MDVGRFDKAGTGPSPPTSCSLSAIAAGRLALKSAPRKSQPNVLPIPIAGLSLRSSSWLCHRGLSCASEVAQPAFRSLCLRAPAASRFERTRGEHIRARGRSIRGDDDLVGLCLRHLGRSKDRGATKAGAGLVISFHACRRTEFRAWLE